MMTESASANVNVSGSPSSDPSCKLCGKFRNMMAKQQTHESQNNSKINNPVSSENLNDASSLKNNGDTNETTNPSGLTLIQTPGSVGNDDIAKSRLLFQSFVSCGKRVYNSSKWIECPLDAEELGRSTWNYLHTMAAYYPVHPSLLQQADMNIFLEKFSQFYPCGDCADHLKSEMKKLPPDTTSRDALSGWLCQIHNEVNVLLGKEMFDCSKLYERWKDGPSNGACK